MSVAEKRARMDHLPAEQRGRAPALAALGLARSTWYYHRRHGRPYAQRYADLQRPLQEIARSHPEYGYRRTTRELRAGYGRVVNHKVVQRLLKAWDLPLIRRLRRPKPSGIRQVLRAAGERANLIAGLTGIEVGQVAYTDFTELVYADGRHKAHCIPVLDHASKVVWGWAVGEHATTELALQAWSRARQQLQRWPLDRRSMIVHQDQDSVFTGYGWTGQLLLKEGVRLSYALNGARDNPEMEAFFSRFKDENRSLLLDAQTLAELSAVVEERMAYYNHDRRHSATDYLAPVTYLNRRLACS